MVLPGENKTFDQFKDDDTFCRGWAAQQSGTKGGWSYDIPYTQCMYLKGNKVPVPGGGGPSFNPGDGGRSGVGARAVTGIVSGA